eukprot:scaffold116873_cov19-Prasinocladus_malaysianus.AAC.1
MAASALVASVNSVHWDFWAIAEMIYMAASVLFTLVVSVHWDSWAIAGKNGFTDSNAPEVSSDQKSQCSGDAPGP